MSLTTTLANLDAFFRALVAHPMPVGVALFGATLLLLLIRIPSGRPVPVMFSMAFLMMVIPSAVAYAAGFISVTAPITAGFLATLYLLADEVYYSLYPMFDVPMFIKDLVFIGQRLMKKQTTEK